jgi:phasin family protein
MTQETVQVWEQATEVGRSALEAMLRMQQIGARGMERLAEQQVAAANEWFEMGTRQLQALNDVKAPDDLWSTQARLASEVGEKWTAHASKMLELSLESQSDVVKLLAAQMSSWAPKPKEKVKAAAPRS